MSFVSRDKMDEYEEQLKDFHFDWPKFDLVGPAAEGFRAREWQLLIDAEHIGIEAVQLFRKYQAGVA